jgi:hypothetical protein
MWTRFVTIGGYNGKLMWNLDSNFCWQTYRTEPVGGQLHITITCLRFFVGHYSTRINCMRFQLMKNYAKHRKRRTPTLRGTSERSKPCMNYWLPYLFQCSMSVRSCREHMQYSMTVIFFRLLWFKDDLNGTSARILCFDICALGRVITIVPTYVRHA